jgi:hypothetical protein
MRFQLKYSDEANRKLDELEIQNSPKLTKVLKTLGLMESNLRHTGLHTHKYSAIKGDNGEEVWEAYVENNTPSAYRVFWHYGPGQGIITIFAITQHP